MFKLLITIILLSNLSQGFSAELKKISNFKSANLERINQASQELLETFNGDIYLNSFSFEIISKKETERIEDSFKQAIYIEYSQPYSLPEFSSVVALRKKTLDDELRLVLEPFEIYSTVRGIHFPSIKNFVLDTANQVLITSEVEVYAFDHGNSFGQSIGVMFFDSETKEFLALERVYAE